MKILSIKIGGNFLFPDGLFIDFKNSDSVRKSAENGLYYKSAHRIKSGVYNQVLISFVGLNATGKTTILQLIGFIANIVLMHQSLDNEMSNILLKKLHISSEQKLKFEVEVLNKNKVFILESEIVENKSSFIFNDEILYEIPLKKYKNNVEKKDFSIIKQRHDEKNNVYLKQDESIIKSISDEKGAFITNSQLVNFNYAAWTGSPPTEILKLFDSGIKQIKIEVDNEFDFRTSKASVQFERDSCTTEKSPLGLEFILSSGTIKGLSIIPSIIYALSKGGYIVIDEIENHLNKRLVTFILDLFTDEISNPKGACLIFSTHYPELLDKLTRKDNIYISTRDEKECLHLQRLSDSDKDIRKNIKNSEVILFNLVKGTAPKFFVLKKARDKIIEVLNSKLEDM